MYAFDEYLDRCILEVALNNMLEEYQQTQERQIHTKELTEKKRRVS